MVWLWIWFQASRTVQCVNCTALFAVNVLPNFSRLRRAKGQLEYPFQNAPPVGPRLVVPTHWRRGRGATSPLQIQWPQGQAMSLGLSSGAVGGGGAPGPTGLARLGPSGG